MMVFCRRCWYYKSYEYGSPDCRAPQNSRRRWTAKMMYVDHIQKPEKANQNNDCKWYKVSWWVAPLLKLHLIKRWP